MAQGYVWREPWAIPQLLYESCPIRMCYTSFWPEFQGDSESAAINIKFCPWHPLWLVCITHGNYNNCVMQYLLELQGSLFWVNCGFGWLLFLNSVRKLTTIFDQAVPTVPRGFPWLLRASQAHSFLPLGKCFWYWMSRPFWVVLGIFPPSLFGLTQELPACCFPLALQGLPNAYPPCSLHRYHKVLSD